VPPEEVSERGSSSALTSSESPVCFCPKRS
jgi:hypothetical protein